MMKRFRHLKATICIGIASVLLIIIFVWNLLGLAGEQILLQACGNGNLATAEFQTPIRAAFFSLDN
jgi:hypothetical protein